MHENRELRELNISNILPNRFQPRLKFETDSLEQLAESISRFGVIEPVVVRPVGNKFEIIAGERRYKASKIAGKSTIPAIVVNLSDKDSEELALLENVQRKALNPIEEAVSYKRILDAGYINREELAKKIGKPQTEIVSKIRLLNLADEVQSYLLNNKISERHARSLLKISNLDDQVEILHRIVNERLTVKQTDREIRKMLGKTSVNLNQVEVLSINERGNDKMDIDKIMQEAQDINQTPEATSPMPDLMAKSNDVQSEPIVRNDNLETPTNLNDDNKFVTQMPAETPMATPVEAPEPVAMPESITPAPMPAPVEASTPAAPNFDDMFNQPLNNINEVPFNQNIPPVAPEPMPMVDSINQQGISGTGFDTFNNPNSNPDLGINDSSKFINIPDTNILQDNIPMNNESSINVNPINAVPSQKADFATIVKILRDSADEIERNGYFVNLDEMDLGTQYKVTITIDK